ncbi:MAG: hypothetical protein LUQ47_03700 [Methanotrichaceae archaeon]|nr:hypothetical protein [Methanotrichaceae archaeon]
MGQKPKPKSFHSKREKAGTRVPIIEYYQRPFALLHLENDNSGYDPESPHPIRGRFWRHPIPRHYDQHEARIMLQRYFVSLERELADVIGRNSIAYWLHVYRRLSPGFIVGDHRPETIGLVRAAFEAGIQKYGRFEPCNKVGFSKDIPLSKILGGLLLSNEFAREREYIEESGNQLVLTAFTNHELREFYDVEKLVYEIWYTSALLRIVGKGAPLIVGDPPEWVWDDRSEELDTLVKIYDSRKRPMEVTSFGVCYESFAHEPREIIFLPTYNLTGITAKEINPLLRKLFKSQIATELESEFKFNFIWLPFNIRRFRQAHLPLANAFHDHHGVSLDGVLLVLTALAIRVFYSWTNLGIDYFLRHWQRAYDGPNEIRFIRNQIDYLLPHAARILETKEKVDIDLAIKFWDLGSTERKEIDLAYSGPHFMFLPLKDDRIFIDFAWCLRRLYDMFIGISISDQNFKADALEKAVGRDPSFLPKGPCRTSDGKLKQIDYACPIGKHLVIAECKAVRRSIAFDRGDPRAIQYRRDKIVDRSLSEADEKARWLAENPLGSNYDIRKFRDILPLGVSPFIEYIPSLNPHYWIAEKYPRVLTPSELRDLLNDTQTIDKSLNRIVINN